MSPAQPAYTPPGHRQIADLPLFDEWDSEAFGLDFGWVTDDLFRRPYQGPLRGSDGSIVFYRNADVRAIGTAKESTHTTLEQMSVAAFAREGHDVGAILQLFESTFVLRQPEHLINKKIMSRRLATGSVARWERNTAEVVANQLAKIEDGSAFDFVADFARPLVVDFWHRALGVTPTEGEELVAALEEVQSNSRQTTDAAKIRRANEGAQRYLCVFPAALQREMDAGRNPILNELRAEYEQTGDATRPADPCVAFATTLMDGWRTIPGVLGAVMFSLLADGPAYAQVKSDPASVSSAFQEGIRLHPGIILTQREALCDFVYDSVEIPGGSTLTLLWLFANRDPSIFEDPNTYRLDRENRSRQTSFGGGLYACTGRHVVRMLFETVIRALTAPGVEISLSGDARWLPATVVHEIEYLPVTVRRS